jgi:hypothetical protein
MVKPFVGEGNGSNVSWRYQIVMSASKPGAMVSLFRSPYSLAD